MTKFEKSWSRQPSDGIVKQIKGMVKKEGPLKPQVAGAIRTLNHPISKLDYMANKLAEKDAKLFQRIVEAQQKHDATTSKVLANELAELRKNEKMISNMRLSLDQVRLRLSTANELGDAVVALGPAMSAMRTMGPALAKFMPEAGGELESMGNTLGGLMTNSFEGSFETNVGSSEETDMIIKEAAAVAEQDVGDKLPIVPTEGDTSMSSTATESF